MHGHMRMKGRHGRPPWGGGEWGGGGGNWRGGGRRMRRGDIRTALLGALTDGPAHGYELIGRLVHLALTEIDQFVDEIAQPEALGIDRGHGKSSYLTAI